MTLWPGNQCYFRHRNARARSADDGSDYGADDLEVLGSRPDANRLVLVAVAERRECDLPVIGADANRV